MLGGGQREGCRQLRLWCDCICSYDSGSERLGCSIEDKVIREELKGFFLFIGFRFSEISFYTALKKVNI